MKVIVKKGFNFFGHDIVVGSMYDLYKSEDEGLCKGRIIIGDEFPPCDLPHSFFDQHFEFYDDSIAISRMQLESKIEELKKKKDYWKLEMDHEYDKWVESGKKDLYSYNSTPESQFDKFSGMIMALNYILGKGLI